MAVLPDNAIVRLPTKGFEPLNVVPGRVDQNSRAGRCYVLIGGFACSPVSA